MENSCNMDLETQVQGKSMFVLHQIRVLHGVIRKHASCVSCCLVAAVCLSGCLVDAQIDTPGGDQKKPTPAGTEAGSVGEGQTTGADGTENGAAEGGFECGEAADSVCVPHAPLGWRGPIQPQQADEPQKLLPCDGPPLNFVVPGRWDSETKAPQGFPNPKANLFVDRVEADSAVCRGGCEFNLDIGDCFPMNFVIRELESTGPNKCGKPLGDSPAPMLLPTCEKIDPRWLTSPNHAIGAAPPKPFKGEALCEPKGVPQFEVSDARFGEYYRLCQPEDNPNGDCPPGRTCSKFDDLSQPGRMPMSCVYKPGDVSCPSGVYNDRRIVIYGSAKDERGCGECEVEHQRGELVCQYSMRIAKGDSDGTCEGGEQVRAEDICLTKEDLSGPNSPIAALGEYLYPAYTGTCVAKELAPQGEVVLGDPMTLCCADF